MKPWWIHPLAIAVAASSFIQAATAQFAAPADGPPPFRRDRLPLDSDTMTALSRQLETLARGLAPEEAPDRRGVAQMLALSIALNPSNTQARQLLQKHVQHHGQFKPAPEADRAERVDRARARIWQLIAWLESPGAGNDGHALAACLKDVMVVSDPKNPRSAALKPAGEQAAWDGWVPPLAAYQKTAPTTPGGDTQPPEKEPGQTSPPVEPPDEELPRLAEAAVTSLVWLRPNTPSSSGWILAPSQITMSASLQDPQDGENVPFSLRIGPAEDWGPLTQTAKLVTATLQKHHGKLPERLKIRITSKEIERSMDAKRRHPVSAACAVLANAALTGIEPDAVILGQIGASGEFSSPPGLWDQLRALGPGNGKRLVLPADAATGILPSVLAMEKPEFFTQYEVVLAKDFAELVELSTKEPQGVMANAGPRFREIRERQSNLDLRQYIGNPYVKQRLQAIYQEAPFHFSSKALFVQASGNRPTLVSRNVLALELRRALEPMNWLVSNQEYQNSQAKSSKLGTLYDQCRTNVDGLARYAQKTDLPLIEKGRAVVTSLRNVERASRSRGENYQVMSAVQSARNSLVRVYQEFASMIADATGEAQNP